MGVLSFENIKYIETILFTDEWILKNKHILKKSYNII